MRNKYFLIIFFFIIPLFTFAQGEYASFDVPQTNAFSIQINMAANGDICYAFKFEKDYYFVIVSAEKEVIYSEKIHENASIDPYFCGTLVNDHQFIFFNRLKFNHDILNAHIIHRDKHRYEEIKNIKFLDVPKEEHVTVVNTDNEFYILSISKKTESLYITRFSDATNYIKKEFKINIPEIYKHFKKKDLVFINKNSFNSIYHSHFNNKIYLEKNNFYITFKDFPGAIPGSYHYTEILKLNWLTEKSDYSYLVNLTANHENSFNTDIYKNHLIQFTKNKYMVNLSFYDLESLKEVKSYQFDGTEKLDIMSGPLFVNEFKGSFYADILHTQNTSEITNQLYKGIASVCAFDPGNGFLELDIGSFFPANNSSPVIAPAFGALGVIILSSGNGNGVGSKYFTSLFDYPEFTDVGNDNYKSLKGQLRDYISDLVKSKIKISADIIYLTSPGDAHYGYINRKTKKFHVAEFENN